MVQPHSSASNAADIALKLPNHLHLNPLRVVEGQLEQYIPTGVREKGKMAEDKIKVDAPEPNDTPSKPSTPHSKSGWDGKLRVNKQATLANPEALSDPEYSDDDAPPVDQIAADEGEISLRTVPGTWLTLARSVG